MAFACRVRPRRRLARRLLGPRARREGCKKDVRFAQQEPSANALAEHLFVRRREAAARPPQVEPCQRNASVGPKSMNRARRPRRVAKFEYARFHTSDPL